MPPVSPSAPDSEDTCTIVIVTADTARFVRRVPVDVSVLEVIGALAEHVEAAGLSASSVKTEVDSCLSCQTMLPIYFTNICGKIDHYDVCSVTQPGIQPYVKDHTDAFGSALCIYSKECSLRINKALTNTLFRGGGSTAGIAQVIRHAILPETVRDISVHMIVASARLGWPVFMHEQFLVSKFQDCKDWQCQENIIDGEMQKYHSLKLHSFDGDWMRRMGLEDKHRPQSCLLNICRTGTVNMFLSISPGVPFEEDLETRYTLMLNAITDYIKRFT